MMHGRQCKNGIVMIGLEIHAQLLGRHKLFSLGAGVGCFGSGSGTDSLVHRYPNTSVDYFDMAIPGSLPRLNQSCVDQAIRAGIALNCNINEKSRFVRKSYFYPDLPSGYQITQQEAPICSNGCINGIHIDRIQLEQDSGKTIQIDQCGNSGIDLNRAGIGLIEIVTLPDFRSSEQVIETCKEIQDILRSIDVCDGIMANGSIRFDVNISISPGPRVEIKNLNSYRSMYRAIQHEIERQTKDPLCVQRETRSFNVMTGETERLRSKEQLADYRIFPDPDLPQLYVSTEHIESIRSTLPLLPAQIISQLQQTYLLSLEQCQLLYKQQGAIVFFKQMTRHTEEYQLSCKWMINELFGRLHDYNCTIEGSPISAQQLALVVNYIRSGYISGKVAKLIIDQFFENSIDPSNTPMTVDEIIQNNNWMQISDHKLIENVCCEVVRTYPEQIQQYKQGKHRQFNYLCAQVNKHFQNRANPQIISQLLHNQINKVE